MLQSTISFINSQGFNSVLCLGVGVRSLWYDKIKAEDKKGVDKYDKTLFPRLWTQPSKGVRKSITKGEFEAIIINDSKHYNDLEKLFKLACERLKEGGKIIFTHSLPDNINLVRKDFKPHQNWCGDVYEFILNLKAKGGYDIETYDIDNGISIVSVDPQVSPVELTIEPFEEWFFNRKELMNIK